MELNFHRCSQIFPTSQPLNLLHPLLMQVPFIFVYPSSFALCIQFPIVFLKSSIHLVCGLSQCLLLFIVSYLPQCLFFSIGILSIIFFFLFQVFWSSRYHLNELYDRLIYIWLVRLFYTFYFSPVFLVSYLFLLYPILHHFHNINWK